MSARDQDFRAQPHKRAQGAVGEAAAEAWLTRHGFRIVERNLRNRGGELDVVAWDGATLCFIEVKARSNAAFGRAIEAISAAKQRKIARAAALYLTSWRETPPCRFDVLAMDLGPEGWSFDLVRNAFERGG